MIDLAPIKARLEAATKGEWEASGPYVFKGKNCFIICDTDVFPQKINEDNAALIAHAPVDLKALVEEVERLRELLDCARDEYESTQGRHLDGAPHWTVGARAALQEE